MVMTLLESNRRLEERLRYIEDTTKYSPTHSRSPFAALGYPIDPVDGSQWAQSSPCRFR